MAWGVPPRWTGAQWCKQMTPVGGAMRPSCPQALHKVPASVRGFGPLLNLRGAHMSKGIAVPSVPAKRLASDCICRKVRGSSVSFPSPTHFLCAARARTNDPWAILGRLLSGCCVLKRREGSRTSRRRWSCRCRPCCRPPWSQNRPPRACTATRPASTTHRCERAPGRGERARPWPRPSAPADAPRARSGPRSARWMQTCTGRQRAATEGRRAHEQRLSRGPARESHERKR